MASDKVERRLAAILAADVAGYSRLMSEDEAGTLTALKALRAEVIEPVIADHRGRVVKLMGDGLLVAFQSAVDAVDCAVAWQSGLGQRPDNPPLRFRIGINLGDIVIDDNDLYGDGVNVAARLEGLASPGGIALSQVVHDQVDGKVEARFEDMGEHTVKNIAKPIRVYRVRLDEPTAETGSETAATTPPDKPSIAVLPFENLSGSPDEEYFADGITDEITLLLSRNRWLQVISRHSSFALKERALDAREIAETLGVRYLIAGSVRRAGPRVRVGAQLVQTADGTQLWSERYERELADIFDLQDEIAQTIAGTLEPELAEAEVARVRRRPPESWTAWDFLQRGRWQVFKFTDAGFAEAERLFARALAIDSTLARAHAGLAYVYIQEAFYGGPTNRPAVLEAALQSARRAVQEDDRDALSHFVLGRVHSLYRRYDESIAELETALELNPSYAHAHFALGFTLTYSRHPAEAIPHFERFEALSPRDPHSWSNENVHATAYLWLGDLEAAEDFAARSVRHPNATRWAFATHAAVLGQAGKTMAAQAAARRLDERHPGYSCETARDDFFFMDDPEHLEVYLDGLRKAGVPERSPA